MNSSLKNLRDQLSLPHLPVVDVSKITLAFDHLNEILKYLDGNYVTYYIVGLFKNWPKLSGDSEAKRVLNEIQSRLRVNADRHPSDFVHALLSNHAYRSSPASEESVTFLEEEARFNEYLKEWILCYALKDDTSGYYGAIYKNQDRKQVVVAHRGTVLTSMNVLNDIKTDIIGITFGNIKDRGHFMRCREITLKALEDYRDYSVSFTGHSLGAFLAELSMFFCAQQLKGKEMRAVKAVNFESPGSERVLQSLQTDIDASEVVNLGSLNIVSYLVQPNLVNSCNKHLGTIYVLNPSIETSGFNKILASRSFTYRSMHNLKAHSLSYSLNEFDPITGIPRRCQVAKNWPRCPVNSVLDFITKFVTKKYAMELRTLDQIMSQASESFFLDTDRSLEELCSVYYSVEDLDDFKASLDLTDKQTVDYWLLRLAKTTRLNAHGSVEQRALVEIRSLYEIENVSPGKYEIRMKGQVLALRDLKCFIAKFKSQGTLNVLLNRKRLIWPCFGLKKLLLRSKL